MGRLLIRSILLSAHLPTCFAQWAPDSVSHALPAHTVIGSGIVHRAAAASASVTTVDAARSIFAPSLSIDRVLRNEAFVYVRDRGGSGAVKTAGLRGLGAQHTLLTWDAMRLTSTQNGIADLGLYPASLFDGLTVLRGAQSSTLGSGAMGGAIALRSGFHGPQGATVGLTAGSFGRSGVTAGYRTGSATDGLLVKGGLDRAENDFPFTRNDGSGPTRGHRSNSGSRHLYGFVKAGSSLSESSVLTASLYGISARRSSPGPSLQLLPSEAVLTDRLVQAGVAMRRSGTGSVSTITLSGLFHDQGYVDRSAAPPIDETYATRNAGIAVYHAAELAAGTDVHLGLEADRQAMRARTLGGRKVRTSGALLMSGSQTLDGGSWHVHPSVRLDVYSDVVPQVSMKLAFSRAADDQQLFRIRAGVGTAFRVPSFNELYWVQGGNPSLRHERSVMAEAGLEWRIQAFVPVDISAAMFASRSTDQIIGWPPVNLSRSRAWGGDLQATWENSEGFWLKAGCAWSRAVSEEGAYRGRQVPFVPEWTASMSAGIPIAGLQCQPSAEYVSRRFSTLDNVAALSTEPYVVTSLAVRLPQGRWIDGVTITAFIDNIFDRQYAVVPEYPMPGRSFIISCEVAL